LGGARRKPAKTVSDLTDNPADAGSIRYAVNQVNADTSSAQDPIDLTGVSGALTLSNGVLDRTRTTGPIMITGSGASALTISGSLFRKKPIELIVTCVFVRKLRESTVGPGAARTGPRA
jgi:hypothetical protein